MDERDRWTNKQTYSIYNTWMWINRVGHAHTHTHTHIHTHTHVHSHAHKTTNDNIIIQSIISRYLYISRYTYLHFIE